YDFCFFFFFSSRRRHTRSYGDWSSDVCSSDLRTMFKKMLRNGAGRIALFTFALLAPCVQNTVFGQTLNRDGQSVADVVSAPSNSFGAPTTGRCICSSERDRHFNS